MTSVGDDVLVIAIATAASAAVGAGGALAHRALRTRSLAGSLVVVALVGVGAVLAAALGTARVMFLSGHDFRVLLIVSVVAGAMATGIGVALSRGVARGGRELAVGAQSLGERPYLRAAVPLPTELAEVDSALHAASGRLRAAVARERALEASRRELVAWISHDLRTPLAGIRAMSEALEDGIATDPALVARYHGAIRTEADRLAAMVDDLFELSRINASVLVLTLHPVSLADVVSDALASAGPLALAQRVRLQASAEEDLPLVSGSAPELGRVLRNLLSNAIRYTPEGGTVRVELDASGGEVVLRVADTCGGIPEQDLPRLFDVAFRGSAARTPDQDSGAGLGLAIVQGLVEAHGGSAVITNTGPGCSAVVRLPALAAVGTATGG